MDDDPDDTVLSPPRVTSPASGESEVDDADTIVHARAEAIAAASAAHPNLDVELDLDKLLDPPRIDHATGLPVLPDLLEVPRAPDTEPLQIISYALRLAGTVVPLDREVFVGRNPSPPRITGGPPPRLVTVPSPTSDVSRTHLGVRQLGASVIVTDLRSTNGSTVEVPGSQPRTLRQGESMVVSAGTRIDIGDGIVIEVHRLQPAGATS